MTKENIVRQFKVAPPSESPGEVAVKRFEEDLTDVKEFLNKSINPGWALVCYDRKKNDEGKPVLRTYVQYFCTDPFDAFTLPDLARGEIIRVRDERD